MGVPSIEAEEAVASSLLMSIPIASLPGRLPLRVIDSIRDLKSRIRPESGKGDVLGTKLWK